MGRNGGEMQISVVELWSLLNASGVGRVRMTERGRGRGRESTLY